MIETSFSEPEEAPRFQEEPNLPWAYYHSQVLIQEGHSLGDFQLHIYADDDEEKQTFADNADFPFLEIIHHSHPSYDWCTIRTYCYAAGYTPVGSDRFIQDFNRVWQVAIK